MSYHELYVSLYGAIADALDQLDEGNIVTAIHILKSAHITAEEKILELDVIPDECFCKCGFCRFFLDISGVLY